MANKGDKARLYDVAFRRYVEGQSLTAIEEQLGVSRQTLAQWKADTKRPSDELDEWDRARGQKRSVIQKLNDIVEREVDAIHALPAGSLTSASADALGKLGALVERWGKIEAEARRQAKVEAAEAATQVAKRGGLSAETVQALRREILGVHE